MLQFYINRGAELQVRPPFSRLLTLASCAGITHEAVPLTHIYVTTSHYAGLLKQALEKQAPGTRTQGIQNPVKHNTTDQSTVKHREQTNPLTRLLESDTLRLMTLDAFPKSARNLGFKSVSECHNFFQQHSRDALRPRFALVNGIGTGLGDNYVGLGVLQRFIKLLAPMRPQFCLLQELEERIEPVYRSMPEVSIAPSCMPLNDFLKFDYFIDFSSIENMPSFNDVAAVHFNMHAFSINNLLPSRDIQPTLSIGKAKTQALKAHIHQTLPADRKTVLLHPLASSSLRKLPSQKAAEITQQLGRAGYNVVSAFDHSSPPEHFLSLAEHSHTIDDLLHIVDAVDAVISVGTVVYHLASALGKPTLLLPTVQADIRSAELLPEVMTWLPAANQGLYPNLHKSERPEDLAVAKHLWRNVDAADVVHALDGHIRSLTDRSRRWNRHTRNTDRAPSRAARVGVVIPHAPQTQQLASCLDALTRVEGFDPQYLYTIESHGLGHSHHHYTDAFNTGIDQALADRCDCVCLLHENASVPPHYLSTLMTHFHHSHKVGIVSGAVTGAESLYGRANLLPDPLQSGRRSGSGAALQQPWVSFPSCLIRAEVFNNVAKLDVTMQRLFSDVDFCVRAAQHGWQTWFDPTINTEFSTQAVIGTTLNSTLTQSAQAFYTKWGRQFDATQPERIEESLLTHVGF